MPIAPLVALYFLLGTPTQETALPPMSTSQAFPEPEDIAVVHYFQPKGGILPLEMHRAQLVNDRGGIFRGAKELLVLPGVTSPIQFYEDQLPEFVVNVLLPMQLPTEFELFPLEIQRRENRRAIVLTNDGWWSSRGSQGFHLRTRRYGSSSFKILLTRPLPPGEYAFKYGLSAYKSKDLYCFTVLPKAPKATATGAP